MTGNEDLEKDKLDTGVIDEEDKPDLDPEKGVLDPENPDLEDPEKEVPFWMQEDEPESSDAGDVPVAKHVDIKRKLKGKISERDEEIDRLKAQVEELKTGGTKTGEAPKRPRSADFDNDEEFEAALDKYEEDKLEYLSGSVMQTQQQKQSLEQRRRSLDQSMDDHVERAAGLIQKSGISPDVYQQAQENIKGIIANALPGNNADSVYTEFVHRLGVGSEKVMFYVGRNKAQANEFARLMAEDPSGLAAAVFLGDKKREVSGAKNQTSRAPAPSAQVRGDEASTAKGSALKRKYDEAHKKGKTQDAYNFKQEAKKQGLDVSKWSR